MTTITGTSAGNILNGNPARPVDGSLTILIGNAGNDTLNGFGGYWNIADYGTSPVGILGNLAAGQVSDGFGGTDTLVDILAIRGSANNDTLIGTYSYAWTSLEGMAGNDIIYGNKNGANGVTYSQSPSGVVVNLTSGTASDGWGTTDTLVGVVRLAGSRFSDRLAGSAADDWFEASYGSDTIFGAGGINTLDYTVFNGGLVNGANVTLTDDNAGTVTKRAWGASRDYVDLFFGIQVIKGTSGAERMTGWADATRDTYLRPLSGNDTIDGAKNAHNVADYIDSPNAVVITLETGIAGADWFGTASDGHQVPGQPAGTYSVDTLKNVVAINGSRFGDSITGSSQDDVITGNAGNDTIRGGAGSDTSVLEGNKADATWWKNSDGSWSIHNGFSTDRLYDIEDVAFDDGVVHLSRTPGDFDGNGRTDILFSNDTLTWMGTPYSGLVQWKMNGFAFTGDGYFPPATQGWSVVATGDFNGDGANDLVWQSATQSVAIWLMDDTTFLVGTSIYDPDPANAWAVTGTGDFNGDGKADLLWRHEVVDAGHTYTQLAVWTMNGLNFLNNTQLGQGEADWHVSGVADFNGDSDADILWSRDGGETAIWMSDGAGNLVGSGIGFAGPGWHVAGTGDFNGDGKADILWRGDTGEVSIWLMNGTHGTGQTIGYNPGTEWLIAKTGDFNGDGKSDILWRHAPVPGSSNTDIAIWLMDGFNGTGRSIGTAANDWHIV